MITLSDKLRLIMEGHTMETINSGKFQFSSITNTPLDECSIFFESVIIDMDFISESHIFNESVLDTIGDKFKKFISWIMEKINNIIKWIRNNFFKKADEVTVIANRVEKKISTGEIDKKIENIKNNKPSEEPDVKPIELNVRIPENIPEDKMKDIISAANKIIEVIKSANLVANNFNNPVGATKGPRKAESIEAFLCSKLSDGEIENVEQLAEYISGNIEEFELTSGLAKKVIKTVKKLKDNSDELIKVYNIYKDKIQNWQTYVHKSLINVSDELREKAIEHLDYMFQLNTTILKVLTKLMAINNKVLIDCENVLKRFDSM